MSRTPSIQGMKRQLTDHEIATACIILWEYCYDSGLHEALDEFTWYLNDLGYSWEDGARSDSSSSNT
jgi:hypothetical protein